jgi:GGDEF domain-containing protein
MKLEYHHLSKSALAGVLFTAVYQLASLTLSGSISLGCIFLFSALFSAYLLIDEQLTPNQDHQTHYFLLLLGSWLPLFVLLYAQNLNSTSFGVWFCVLIFCSFVLLNPSRALRINGLALLIFWLYVLISETRLSNIETGLALSLISVLMGIINQQVNNLHDKLDIARKSDQLTGCMLPEQFKYELDKAHQLYQRYGTPFSLISIEYATSFVSEIDLQTWLKEFAQLYQSRLRKTDALCRFNSHKFMILLPSTNKVNASRLSNDLEKCAAAYQFSFLKLAHECEQNPLLSFSILNYSGDETSKRWLRSLQSHQNYPVMK